MKIINCNLKIKVIDASTHLPETTATSNEELIEFMMTQKNTTMNSSMVKKMSDKIFNQFGVKERYFVKKPHRSKSDLCDTTEDLAISSLNKLKSSSLDNVDCFLFGSTTSNRFTGSISASLSKNLKNNPSCYDIKAGCSTSLAVLNNAVSQFMLGHKKIILTTSETLSKVINPNIPETWFGLADGAASIVLESENENSENADYIILQTSFAIDGKYVDTYTVRASLPPSQSSFNQEDYYIAGDGKLLETVAMQKYSEMFDAIYNGKYWEKIKWIIPHQVNKTIINSLLEKYPTSAKIVWNADKIGNIGGSSIMYSLADCILNGCFQKGDLILLISVGGGISYSFQIWEKQ